MKVEGGESTVSISETVLEKLERVRLERRENLSRYWTDEEVAILQGYYNLVPRSLLLEALPKRTWAGICCKIGNLREDGETFVYEEEK